MSTEKPIKILVVDDEPDMSHIIAMTYKKEIRSGEFSFRFALNGRAALDILREDSEILLVLTDINMPEMDGLSLVRELRGLNPAIRAVVISAYGDMVNIRRAMNYGAYDFLIKPIDLQDLKITVKRTLDEIDLITRAMVDRDRFIEIKKEMEIARQLQLGMMPQVPCHIGEFTLEGQIRLSSDVGGDFWDLIPLDGEESLLVLGDCCGHGLGSALIMSAIRHSLRTLVTQIRDFVTLVPVLNQILYREFKLKAAYATMVFVVFRHDESEVRLLRAGHELPLFRKQGSFLPADWRGGLPIGLFPKRPKDEWISFKFERGDELYLYTDGIVYGLPNHEPEMEALLGQVDDVAGKLAEQSLFQELERSWSWRALDDATLLKITRS